MTVPSLSKIEELHNLMSNGHATRDEIELAREQRNHMIRELANTMNCPRCEGQGAAPLDDLLIPWEMRKCPDCGGSGDPPSYAEIGRRLGVSRERIRQIAVGKT
jgi:Sigma-70, region 4